MNYKIKTTLLAMLAATLILFLGCGAVAVYAEEGNDYVQEEVQDDTLDSSEEVPSEETPVETPDESPEDEPEQTPDTDTPPEEEPDITEDDPSDMTDGEIGADFVEWLKATFGSDYEYYYNLIIENWGSIEDYLLEFGESHLPDSFQAGLEIVISWLSKYVTIWAPVLAIIIIIFVYCMAKRRFKKIVSEAVDSQMTIVSTELNKQARATMAVMHAQKALLGKNAKFADTISEIETSENELNSASNKE